MAVRGNEPSLTHVCRWNGHGWKSITAEEASKLYPYGTVHADSGLFMCDLCGQYVILTKGNKKIRHFKHSLEEDDKNCPERTFGPGNPYVYKLQSHNLPIRISFLNRSHTSFRLEMGFFHIPEELRKKNFSILIQPAVNELMRPIEIKSNQLLNKHITYFPLWNQRIFDSYKISFKNGNNELYKALSTFWSSEVRGIDHEGTLFNKGSGRRLSYDADVKVGWEYYLLKRSFPPKSSRSITVKNIASIILGGEKWILSTVSANTFNEEAIRFFLDLHCRLTERPVSLQPIWPIFVENDSSIIHHEPNMYLLIRGNATTVSTLPESSVRKLGKTPAEIALYKTHCLDRQQLIYAGRTQALQDRYFVNKALTMEGIRPEISVTNSKGAVIRPGERTALPLGKKLYIESRYDGEITISRPGQAVEKQKLSANESAVVDNLAYGSTVRVSIGLDTIWQLHFKEKDERAKRTERTVKIPDNNIKPAKRPVEKPAPTPVAAEPSRAGIKSPIPPASSRYPKIYIPFYVNTKKTAPAPSPAIEKKPKSPAPSEPRKPNPSNLDKSTQKKTTPDSKEPIRKQNSAIKNAEEERKLLQQLTSKTGHAIPIPPSLRNILLGMGRYPYICQWIRACIKKGRINGKAYQKLLSIYRRRNTD
ncbi:MAG TPA: hypothetical protein OIM03_01515 [Veillonellaceae bacterium]|nr:hypothetical protein [Veillonellaceae bacterium]